MSPTSARIWMTGVASTHFGPRTTPTKSGATRRGPRAQGSKNADQTGGADPRVGHPRKVVSHAREGREEDLLERSRDARERDEDDVRRERVHPQCRRTEEAPDQEVAHVAARLVEQVLAEDVAGEAPEPSEARERERHRGPPFREVPEEHGRDGGLDEELRHDRPRSEAPERDGDPDGCAGDRRGDLRSSSRRKRISRTSSACCVVPSAVTRKLTDRTAKSGPTSASP